MNTATATFSEYRNLSLSFIDESHTNPWIAFAFCADTDIIPLDFSPKL